MVDELAVSEVDVVPPHATGPAIVVECMRRTHTGGDAGVVVRLPTWPLLAHDRPEGALHVLWEAQREMVGA
jgi:hypothetical protein